ncbi:MAG: OadG family protein [Candidatus Brocadiia bacterium]
MLTDKLMEGLRIFGIGFSVVFIGMTVLVLAVNLTAFIVKLTNKDRKEEKA